MLNYSWITCWTEEDRPSQNQHPRKWERVSNLHDNTARCTEYWNDCWLGELELSGKTKTGYSLWTGCSSKQKKKQKTKKHLMRKSRLGWKAGIPLHQLCPLTYPLADWGLQPVIRYQTNHIHKIFIIWQSKHTPYRILLSPTSTKPHIQQTVNKLNAEHWALEAFVFSALCNHLIQ